MRTAIVWNGDARRLIGGCGPSKRCGWVLAFFWALLATSAAQGGISDFVVFGRDALTFRGFTTSLGAPVGSNGNISHLGGTGKFSGMLGRGAFLGGTPATRQEVSGLTAFNGDVTIGELSAFQGDVSSGGALVLNGDVDGNVTSANGLSLGSFYEITGSAITGGNAILGSSSQINNNLSANGSVSLDIAAKVLGNVRHGGPLTLEPLASVGSQTSGTTTVTPLVVDPVVVPPNQVFSAGGPAVNLDVFDAATLSPGSYGALTLAGSNDLFLQSGTYRFSSIASPGAFLDLHYNLGGGPIRILVDGPVELNAVRIFLGNTPYGSFDASVAGNVLWETTDQFYLDQRSPSNGSQFLGTIFAPQGEIRIGANGRMTGSVIGGTNVVIGPATNVSYVESLLLPNAPPPLVGDANGDGSVGAGDYAIWAAQFGQTGPALSADFDRSGSVGAGDYTLWAANFGKSASSSVPEPATGVLGLIAAVGLASVALGRVAPMRRTPPGS